ncbi:MAG TPA: type II secretion system protein, partial [Methylophaga sp.]|nr:type II secretion system protein [Methylophaga sp.]
LVQSHSKELTEKTNRNFTQVVGITIDGRFSRQPKKKSTRVKTLLWRAGVEPKERHIVLIVMGILLLTALVAMSKGLLTAIFIPLLVVVFLYLWLQRRASTRIKDILFQLPLFLDQVLRALGTGRSMEGALELATLESPQPLKAVFERVLRENQLGKDLGLAIQETADLYRLHELYLVSLAIRVNRSYGSSVRELIKNIVKMIHQREAARRELKTMTGETRVTAWVLGLLPLVIAGYIMMMNPGYMTTMWEDSSGRFMLFTAVFFQLIGAFALWRMIKSI